MYVGTCDIITIKQSTHEYWRLLCVFSNYKWGLKIYTIVCEYCKLQ